jgi:nucleoside-diphosphate-sugar epimerase
VKVFVTGGTGFIGGEVVRQLRRRGDEVACLVRTPTKAAELTELGCELIAGDLADTEAIRKGMEGADAAIHAAAVYEVGIPASEREAMREANVGGTRNVLGAALEAKVSKVVYVSTVGVGQTHGKTVDESFEAPDGPFTSCYEETKWQAHQVAKQLIGDGLPCTIVQPGGVYGPGDESSIGQMLDQFLAGKMPLIPFPDLGICLAHVEDTAAGIVLALDKGKPGESYFLSGPATTIREAIETVAKVSGKKAPKRAVPTPLLKLMAPIGPLVGKMMGQPPNLRELISAADGVTFWATNEKARRELGYEPRGLEDGLRATLEAEGKLPAAAAA